VKGSSRAVTAVVSAYNEAETIGDVVRVLASSPFFNEVLVVSDGSTDRTAEMAREAGATSVIELSRNGGKGAAMLEGVRKTQAPIIAFFDADLRGLTCSHIEQLVRPVLSGRVSMSVGLRDRGRFFTLLSRFLPLIGGERVLCRELIEKIPPTYLQGFMVESALNYICRFRRLSSSSVLLSGLTIRRKYEKVGWRRGLWQYLRMFAQVGWAMGRVRWARHIGKF